ncbi:co-chaperone GroES [Microbulbifer thermotolerans]|uniref:Co-chaperonin GroES n=1 Tax=Microbulbifer thermotolerans TaxID=252514 RepID=A0A143HIF5_MICTH|nr:co-chaperone GroES [Microbulbifer thermotolerans]AMX01495.1 co-chaperone GroES [Microbulbifer thermotolerans]MCX2778345.1 co-chaperone GroES [Microbulbifer thermotolerans]MCX2783308.1 co-chaperone GroES [Microbulbifer thermotolerans]MCX2796095.1 co-chaperone GroES [Microbulbifer thermotolerans]MCX2800390.1 co-chaperone GroES [Microbulbifer thermotolerans]
MKIKPLQDRVVVKRLPAETTTKGGIVIPDKAAEKSTQGEVCAVGDGVPLDSGELRPLTVKVGDRVLFGQYAGTEVKIDGEDYLIVKESDILAVLDNAEVEEKAA